MTVFGAVVFGGLLALGVLWLLVTAPGSDVDQTGHQAQNSIDVPESLPALWFEPLAELTGSAR